jgi:hypothetical protein
MRYVIILSSIVYKSMNHTSILNTRGVMNVNKGLLIVNIFLFLEILLEYSSLMIGLVFNQFVCLYIRVPV